MNTDRIPSLLAQALLYFDGRIPVDCGEENGCATSGSQPKSGSEAPQQSHVSLVSQINGTTSPVSPWGNSIWKHFQSAGVKNTAETKVDPNLQNDPRRGEALGGFDHGFRFYLFQPDAKHHFDI